MVDTGLSITQVLNTGKLEKHGGELRGSHPVHGSNTGNNLAVDPQQNVAYCFRHQVGAGCLGWVALQEGVVSGCQDLEHGLQGQDFLEACEIANEKYGADIQLEDVDEETVEKNANAREVLSQASEKCHGQLQQDQETWDRIKDERQLRDEDIENHMIGLWTDAVTEHLQSRYTPEALVDSGLFKVGEPDTDNSYKDIDEWRDNVDTDQHNPEDYLYPIIRGRITFPYTRYGRVHYMIGRRTQDQEEYWYSKVDDHLEEVQNEILENPETDAETLQEAKDNWVSRKCGKYVKICETDHNQHIIWQDLDNQDTLVITEGIYDAISVSRAGIDVASPVTTQFNEKDQQKALDVASGYDNVYLAFDGDEAGEDGQRETAEDMLRAGIRPQMISLEGGQDLDDWTTDEGYDLQPLLDSSQAYLQQLIEGCDEISDPIDKKEKQREVLELVSSWSEHQQQGVVEMWSQYEGVTKTDLNSILSDIDSNQGTDNTSSVSTAGQDSTQEGDEQNYMLGTELEKKRIPDNMSIADMESPQLGYYLSDYMVKNFDVKAFILDLEDSSYQLWSYHPANKVWRPNGREWVKKIGKDQYKFYYSRGVKNQTIEHLESHSPMLFEKTGAEDGEIAVQNGLLDLEDRELQEIEKQDYILSKLPVEYDPEAEPPQLWLEYLEDSVVNQRGIDKLQEFAGYTLRRTCKHEKGLMLLGPTDSGKSVFLDVMRAMLGEDNVSQEALQDLTDTRWAVASLKGKLANIDHDLNPKAIENISDVKKLTSGNEMTAEKKHIKKFDITPRAKLMFSANRVPDTHHDDNAFYNRWLTVTFPQTVSEDKMDKELDDKLTTEENLSGILNWALEGLDRLEEQEEFTAELGPIATKDLWAKHGNSVDRFVARWCVTESQWERNHDEDEQKPMFKVHTEDLYNVYTKFASKQGFEIESDQGLAQKLKQKPQVKKRRVQINNKRKRGFSGIKLKEDAYDNIASENEEM